MKISICILIVFLASVYSLYSQSGQIKNRLGASQTHIVVDSTTPSLNEIIWKYRNVVSIELDNYPFDPVKDSSFYLLNDLETVLLRNYPQSIINELLKNISRLKHIRGVGIIDSLLTDFPVAIRNFSHLDYLSIDYARFDTIPDLGDLTIDTLTLRNGNISFLSSNFCRQSKIKALWISNSKYAFIPNGVEKMTELRHLWVNYPQEKALEDILSRFTNDNLIETFYFSSSGITTVPQSIRKLKNLKVLDLFGDTLLSTLPDEMQYLDNLEKIDLGVCGFEEFPKILLKIKNLQTVGLEGNKIRDVGNIFENTTIREISLFNNPLSEESRILIENTVPPGTKIKYPHEVVSLKDRYTTDQKIPRELQLTVFATTPSLNDVIRRRPDVHSIEFNNYIFNTKKDTLLFTLKNLRHVSFVNYNEESLNSILKMVSSQKSIRSISINGNLLFSFPKSLYYLGHLEYLSLENVKFHYILSERESNLTIDTLSLHSDSIVMIFPTFARKLGIKSLQISEPKYYNFPAGFEEMHELKEIILTDFSPEAFEIMLKRIPDDNRIEYFRWSNSVIRSVPVSISKLKNLKKLNFSGDTLLQFLPDEIGDLNNLEMIDLSRCGFIEFPQILFRLRKLELVNLSSNKINNIGCTFENTTIKRIGLFGNPLSAESRKMIGATVPSTTKVGYPR